VNAPGLANQRGSEKEAHVVGENEANKLGGAELERDVVEARQVLRRGDGSHVLARERLSAAVRRRYGGDADTGDARVGANEVAREAAARFVQREVARAARARACAEA